MDTPLKELWVKCDALTVPCRQAVHVFLVFNRLIRTFAMLKNNQFEWGEVRFKFRFWSLLHCWIMLTHEITCFAVWATPLQCVIKKGFSWNTVYIIIILFKIEYDSMQSALRPPLQQLLSEKRSFVSKRKLFIGIDTRYMYLNDGSIFFFKGVCTGVGWVGGNSKLCPFSTIRYIDKNNL